MEHGDLKTFQAHLTTLGVEPPTLQLPPGQTLRPGESISQTVASEAIRTLPELRISDDKRLDSLDTLDDSDFIALQTLGEGGMGLVRLATQVAVDREVAVKTSRKSAEPWAQQSLLREAYITGYLEHPNIVPIYTVGKTSEGAPLIVMKRIEGTSWHDLLFSDEEKNPSLSLIDHIEILLQVCDALRFAHSRGVIHRDIKLDNVMIGHFNEVYLLDWGIALSLRGDKPLLPTREHCQGLSGTPTYMAPEMAHQEIQNQNEGTDIYLLGATLHHLLTGKPRHQGSKLLHVLFQASQSLPFDYPEEIPAELASIANRACHAEPEERFLSVQAFQDALRAFLEHRESTTLTITAEEAAASILQELQAPEPDLFRLHDLFGEARFGFRQALRMWPENQPAKEGLQRCLKAMIGHYLSIENLDGARAAISELPFPSPALSEELHSLEEELSQKEERFQRLQRMEAAFDLSKDSRARSLMALFLGIFWGFTSTYSALQYNSELISHAERLQVHFIAGLRNLVIVSIVMLIFRKSFFTNRVNRSFFFLLTGVLVTVAFVRWTTWYTGADMVLASAADLSLYTLGLFSAGLLTDRRISRLAIFYACAAVLGVFFPAHQAFLEAAATVLTFTGIAFIWWPRNEST